MKKETHTYWTPVITLSISHNYFKLLVLNNKISDDINKESYILLFFTAPSIFWFKDFWESYIQVGT